MMLAGEQGWLWGIGGGGGKSRENPCVLLSHTLKGGGGLSHPHPGVEGVVTSSSWGGGGGCHIFILGGGEGVVTSSSWGGGSCHIFILGGGGVVTSSSWGGGGCHILILGGGEWLILIVAGVGGGRGKVIPCEAFQCEMRSLVRYS